LIEWPLLAAESSHPPDDTLSGWYWPKVARPCYGEFWIKPVVSNSEVTMLSSALVGLSALVIMMLGIAHLIYTFNGPKLLPRDLALQTEMKLVSPVISDETTMWKAWVSFNASHSMGAILFGLVFGYLALKHPELLFSSTFLSVTGFLMLAGLFVLGWRYWFSIPFGGIAISTICYTTGHVVARL
jgi:hypothetical protein